MPPHHRVVLRCLVGLCLALLLVGAVSGTVMRHIVQVLPQILAVAILAKRPSIGAAAAQAIFVFWTVIVGLIWLFLLGLSRIANGTFTGTEVGLTAVMAVCSAVGLARSLPLVTAVPIAARVLTWIAFAVLQVAAMWASFSRSIASD